MDEPLLLAPLTAVACTCLCWPAVHRPTAPTGQVRLSRISTVSVMGCVRIPLYNTILREQPSSHSPATSVLSCPSPLPGTAIILPFSTAETMMRFRQSFLTKLQFIYQKHNKTKTFSLEIWIEFCESSSPSFSRMASI